MKSIRRQQIFLAVLVLTHAAFAQRGMEPRPSHHALVAIPAPPVTPKHPVTDEYHGVAVTDDYRWLENWDDPTVKQ